MSIINKVLQEIEASRKKDNVEPSQERIAMGSSFDQYTSKLSAKVISIVIMVVVLSIILVLLLNRTSTTNNKSATTKTPAAASSPAQKTKPLFPTVKGVSVKLENIVFDVNNNKTTVDFILNKETNYYVERGKDQQQLKLIIGNTTYDKEWPLNLTNTAIKKLTLQKVNNDTVVDLEMLPDTQVMEMQIYHQPQTHLRLSLLNISAQIGTVNKTAIPLTVQQRSTQAYQEALELTNQSKNDAAIIKLREAVKAVQDTPDAYELLATLLTKSNQFTEAGRVLDSAIRAFPGYPRFEQLKAYVLVHNGKTSQALQLLLKNPPEITQDPDYYAFVATLYQQQGEFMLAAQLYDRLLKVQPNRSMWWVGLGIAFESSGKDNAAQEAYRRAAALGDLSQQVQTFINSKIKR